MGECVQERERNRNGERFIATFGEISKVIVLSHMRDKTRMFEQERRDIIIVVVGSTDWMQSHCLAFFSLLFLMLHTIHWLLVLSGLAIPTIG